MAWMWRYESDSGEPIVEPAATSQEFPTQSDAETWIGESWRDLLDSGVTQVVLLEEERVVYGPMGLRPVDN
jgi:hypothetical protein